MHISQAAARNGRPKAVPSATRTPLSLVLLKRSLLEGHADAAEAAALEGFHSHHRLPHSRGGKVGPVTRSLSCRHGGGEKARGHETRWYKSAHHVIVLITEKSDRGLHLPQRGVRWGVTKYYVHQDAGKPSHCVRVSDRQ